MSLQGERQGQVRTWTGTALDYNGDWHALFDADSIASGSFNGRMLAWLNAQMGTTYPDLPGAQAAFAASVGADNWNSIDGTALLNGRVPDWVKALDPDAIAAIDFANERAYGVGGDVYASSFTYAGGTTPATRYFFNGTTYQSFAAEAFRQINAYGARSPEPDSTRYSQHPSTPWTNGTDISASSASIAGTRLGIFSDCCRVASAGAVWHRRRLGADFALTASQPTPFVVFYGTDGASDASGSVRLDIRSYTAAASSIVTGTIGSASAIDSGAGAITSLSETEMATGVWMMTGILTPVNTGQYDLTLGPNSATTGKDIAFYGGYLQSAGPTTPILGNPTGTQALDGDDLTLHLGARTYDLTFYFSDDTTQSVSGQTGDYAVPTDLSGSVITGVALTSPLA